MANVSNIAAALQFCDTHLPPITAGSYTLDTSLTLHINDQPAEVFAHRSIFSVAGQRFAIEPNKIRALFPAAGSLGDFSNALPHLVLDRSTLPWERSPYKPGQRPDAAPWLALLVFHADEAPTVTTITADELQNAATASPWHPAYVLEKGQQPNDPVSVIDVPKSILQCLLPGCADLPYTAHVRQPLDAHDTALDEQAVVLSNRLPSPTGISMAYLVSIETRYGPDGFDFQGAQTDDAIRLVALKYWRFSCAKPEHSFSGLMKGLSKSALAPRIPETARGNPLAIDRLGQGYVALPYQVRNGAQTVAWYRGPLLGGTGTGQASPKLPALSADALISFDTTTAFFDTNHAAAWTLGRLLMLATPSVATALHAYKLTHHNEKRPTSRRFAHLHSAIAPPQAPPPMLPAEVGTWFAALASLNGVPFDYLIADDALLPLESIRFFTLDPEWLGALLDGAFSIGRVTEADQHADITLTLPVDVHDPVSGFLLRSAVVAGWPDLVVNAYDIAPQSDTDLSTVPLKLLRQDRLSSDTLLCLFSGTLQTVDLQPVPQALHCGLDPQDDSLHKSLRNPSTGSIDTSLDISSIPWNPQDPTQTVMSLSALATAMARQLKVPTLSSAEFAMQMIQSEVRVRFSVTAQSSEASQ